MKTRRWTIIVLGLMLLAFAMPAHATHVVKVCSIGCDYAGIQEAIDAVGSESVILIKPGVYAENVVIDGHNNISLANNGGGVVAIVGDKWEGATLTISNSSTIGLQGIHFSGGEPGILLEASRGITLLDNEVQDAWGQGIRMVGSGAQITNTIVTGTKLDRQQENGQGIRLDDSSANLSKNTVMDNAHFGILVAGTSSTLIDNNSVVRNHIVGIAVIDQSEATIQFNLVGEQKGSQVDGRFGRGVESTSEGIVMVMDNYIQNNADSGLSAHNGSQMAAFRNVIQGNGTYGVLLTGNADVALAQNEISGNGGPGVYLAQQAVSVVLGNVIRGNGGAGLGAGFPNIPGESISIQLRNNVFFNNASCDIYVDADTDISIIGENNALFQPLSAACDPGRKLQPGIAVVVRR